MIKREFLLQGNEVEEGANEVMVQSLKDSILESPEFREFAQNNLVDSYGEIDPSRAEVHAYNLAEETVNTTKIWFTVEIDKI